MGEIFGYIAMVSGGVLLGTVIYHAAREVWRLVREIDQLCKDRRAWLDADQAVRAFADTYSADVELNERGIMVFTRDVKAGEIIDVPVHMLETHRRNGGP